MRAFTYLTTFLLFGIVISCKNEKQELLSKIKGKWDVVEVYRNNKFTTTLEGGEFEFFEANKCKTNIFNDTTLYEIILSKDLIIVNSEPKVEYKIIQQQENAMTLSSSIQGYDFEFILKKHNTN